MISLQVAPLVVWASVSRSSCSRFGSGRRGSAPPKSQARQNVTKWPRLRAPFAALELLGPPALIRWQLFRAQTRLAEGVLGSDVADAETLAYLAAWLLEWGGVPPRAWNQAEVSAGFQATDRGQGLVLDVGFSMRLTPVSDGLFERQVDFGINATEVTVGGTS